MIGATAVRILGRLGAGAALRTIRRGLRIVVYHHVGSENDLTRHLGCTTPTDLFHTHVEWLQKNYDIVDLETVSSGGPLPKRPLLITFDDAYRSFLTEAVPVLRSFGLPSTLFLLTDPVFRNRMVLDNLLSFVIARDPDMLSTYTRKSGVDAVRDVLFETIPRGGIPLRDEIYDRLDGKHGHSARELAQEVDLYLRPDDMDHLHNADVRLARHTASHLKLPLAENPDRELLAEWSACGLDDRARAFSYPFGSIADAEATLDAVVAMGIGPLFLVDGCANSPGSRIFFRSSVPTGSIRNLDDEIEIASMLRRSRRRARIARLERRL